MNNLPRPVISIIGLGIGFLLYSLAGRLGQPWETVVLSGLFATKAGPETVVEEYLQAIADGDAAKAKSLLSFEPSDDTLLTDEALDASNALGAIADIVVTPVKNPNLSESVEVSYTIGGTPVTATFPTSDYSDKGEWTIDQGTIDLYLGSSISGLDTTLNGIAVDADTVTVFPGTYELATDNDNFVLSGTTSVVVADPYEYLSSELDPTVELSDAGLAAFRKAITDDVNACLASTSLDPGCGIAIPEVLDDGTKIIDGTIVRTLDAAAQAEMADLTPEDLYGDPMNVYGPYIGSVDVTADCEVDGVRETGCTFLFLPSLGSPLVDFSTDPPTVRWD